MPLLEKASSACEFHSKLRSFEQKPQVCQYACMKMLSAMLSFGRESPIKNSQICCSNGKENSQSTQPYSNTCPFQMTKVRDLDFLQNEENIIYSLQIPISSSRGEISGVYKCKTYQCAIIPGLYNTVHVND